jgi:acyl-CoA synthetase (AMP-forming)/AMP-acid ligase II
MIRADTFWNLVEERATRTPHGLLAVDDRGRRLTFAEFRLAAERVAAGLMARGVRPGGVVSWQLPTWIESLVLAGALARLGVVQNPIIPLNREREVAFIVGQLKSELLVTPAVWRGFDYGAMGRAVRDQVGTLDLLVVDGHLPEGDPSDLPPPPSPDAGSGPRWVLYTSGTTADPKGAQHSDASLMHSAYGMSERMHMTSADRNAIAFPVTHIGGLTLLFADLAVGSASILLETFTHDGIEVLAREGVTLAGSGTPFNLAYLDAQQANPDRRLFPGIRAFPGGGSSRPAAMHGRLLETFGAGLLSGFGLTETGFLAFADLDDPDDAKALTEGRAYPGCELRILDASGTELPRGQEGEICARGPMLMTGYVDASLDVAFDADGYFHTGDLGILDKDGFLSITGRLKEIIIRKGENISALEVENLLAGHPDVREVSVIGLPDASTGERACAVVVPVDSGRPPTLDELSRHLLGGGLSRFKLPEQLEIVESLPRTATGKVTKRFLQERFGSDEQVQIVRL